MAVVCSKCCESISRYDDCISSTNDVSHIFYINCENVTVQTFQELKTIEEILSWKCEFCCTWEVESVAVQTDMGSSESYKCISVPTIESEISFQAPWELISHLIQFPQWKKFLT